VRPRRAGTGGGRKSRKIYPSVASLSAGCASGSSDARNISASGRSAHPRPAIVTPTHTARLPACSAVVGIPAGGELSITARGAADLDADVIVR
jgi:hypothetical protein